MPMGVLTVFQFLETMLVYLFVTLAIPCAVFGKKVSHYRYAKRIMFYFITGNFYVTNLVFALQLLHISNFFTVWAGLIIVPAVAWGIIYKYPLKERVMALRQSFRKMFSGTLGIKSVVVGILDRIRDRIKKALKSAANNYSRNWIDWMLIAAVTLMVLWVYGVRAVRSFGYSASDIPVHLYWVNGMSDNHIFVAGIYPFGMHSIIYLINTAFGIDTYVIFRVFALIQCLAIHIMAVLFLKLCCKSRFAAYPGMFLYSIGNYITNNNFSRFISTLPQEFSMLFILPTAYFALSFFKQKRLEMQQGVKSKDSTVSLVGLAMSFALSFTAHFYGAMVAGLFCVGIGIGHFLWIFRPAYFKRIFITGLLSVLIAVFPMGVAFAMGTPLQGSLYWGSNIIKGVNNQTTAETSDSSTDSEGAETADGESDTESEGGDEALSGEEASDSETSLGTETDISEPEQDVPKPGIVERIKNLGQTMWSAIQYRLNHYILLRPQKWYCFALLYMIGFLIAAGAVFMLFKQQRSYGAMMLSTGLFMVLMSVVFISNSIGIPPLMGADRVCIFYAYVLVVVIGFSLDICCYTVSLILRHKTPMQLLSFAAAAAIAFCIWHEDRIRPSIISDGLEMNEAVTCLTNIISSEEDYKWTIFSANDETNMVYGHGYHYELSTFLHEIQKLKDKPITVPTESVYFFIEKIPLNYTVVYEGSGQMVSREGADNKLPNEEGLGNYQGRNRWIIMSRMYYWAKEFQRLFPNEMKVYFEDDKFICYKLEQNPYRLFDLAIDYGYNT